MRNYQYVTVFYTLELRRQSINGLRRKQLYIACLFGLQLQPINEYRCEQKYSIVKLCCYRNELRRTAIDALFDTLHGYPAEEQKLVSIVDNPGQDDCNKSITKDKGWSVGRCFHEVLSRSIFINEQNNKTDNI